MITKGGRVSCECCECCMYPASGYGTLYQFEDLPSTVVQVSSDSPPVVTVFTKLSSPQPSEDPSVNAISYYRAGGQGIGLDNTEPDEWRGSEIENEDAEFGTCLFEILQLIPPQPLLWRGLQDQFADTYLVSGPVSGTVTRESVCVWRGNNLTLSNFGYQWRVNGNSKSGNQNTPVGSYAGGYSVS